ncbi:MAG: hypothetical protein HZB10_03195 [Candidatus Yonathbacteria bacterium]|nr:hypothetical protein [Candidatus Yonathbacteria bacterium]
MNFIFANIDTIAIAVWLVFFVLVVVRTLRPALVKNVSYKVLVGIALSLYLLYGAVATWGQYRTWATSSDISRALLEAPLAHEVPFPSYLEWTRPLFDHTHGYFWFYSFQHFFLSTIALIIIVGLFLLFLVVRSRTHPINFREGDIMLIALAMLISGWPGVIVLLPIGLVSAILLSIGARVIYGIERIPLPPAFLLASPVAFIYAVPILTALNLYPLLKL